MDRLIHTSLTAMRGAMARQAAIANNLANVNTVGFRRDMTSTQAVYLDGGAFDTRADASEEVVSADMSTGTVTHTGNPLDVALENDALLAVQAQDGSEAYTRRGDLHVNDSGLLLNGDDRPVLGDAGPITLPPADKVRIAEDGSIFIVPVGGDPNQPQRIDGLKLVSAQGSQIRKGMDGLFREENGGTLPADPQARLESESLEGSNVNPTQALVEMIEASRAYEQQARLLSTAKDIDTDGASLMRLPD